MSLSSGVTPSETTMVTPLLSQEGKEFLEGKIDAEQYLQDARRRVEDQATRQVFQHVRFRPSWLLRTLPWGIVCLIYIVIAVLSFAQSENGTGTAAVVTASIAAAVAGIMYPLSRWARSGRIKSGRH
jgi:hypothetical protein